MRQMRSLMSVALIFLAVQTAESKTKVNWAIGEEFEADEGIYFKLLSVSSGWRLWRIETRHGVECRAVKSANGLPHPVPLGVSNLFYGGDPRAVVLWSGYQHKLVVDLEGKGTRNHAVLTRVVGDKFWDDGKTFNPAEGQKIEVSIASWKYPDARIGYQESKGVLDFSGLKLIRERVLECAGPEATKPPKQMVEHPD
jgi:hypothetical protein